jgi:uncharacterized membrane protein
VTKVLEFLSRFDRQDVFAALGLVLLHRGVYMMYAPAAYVLGGLFCLTFVVFMERERRAAEAEDGAGPQLVRGRQ